MGELGTQWLIENVPEVRGDAVIVADVGGPTAIRLGEKGMLWLERILQRIVDGEGRIEDLELIESLGARINGRVLCALADTGILPVLSAVRLFRDDFVRAIENGGDPRPDPMMEVAAGG